MAKRLPHKPAPTEAILVEQALASLRALAALGVPNAAAAILALGTPEERIDPASLALSKIALGCTPDTVTWDQALNQVAAMPASAADLWQCEALRACLGVPSAWNGENYYRMLDNDDECDDEPFYILGDLLERCRLQAPLGPQAHRLLHLLARESDMLLGATFCLHGLFEPSFARALFQPPRLDKSDKPAAVLALMWRTHAILREQGALSPTARPYATVALFQAHAALGARLMDCFQGAYADPIEALLAEGFEPDENEFDECLSLLMAEGWSMQSDAFLPLCCQLPDCPAEGLERRARALSRLAQRDPRLLGASLRGLPLAYHLNIARARTEKVGARTEGAAIDDLFASLCHLGMDPEDVWPRLDPAQAAASAGIRALVERKVLGGCPQPAPNNAPPKREAL